MQQNDVFSPKLSSLVNSLVVSKTIEMHSLTKKMENNGKKVFSLCVGEPDYQPPECVAEAVFNATKNGNTKYYNYSNTNNE